MTDTLPEPCDSRSTTDDNSLPQLNRAERDALLAAHQAIPLASQRVAELGRQWMDAQALYRAHPTDDNYAAMTAALERYEAADDDDRAVEEYLATERKAIASARARRLAVTARTLARHATTTASRPACRAGQTRAPRQRSPRTRRVRTKAATADPYAESGRGVDVLIVERRADPGRRAALIGLLVELMPGGGRP